MNENIYSRQDNKVAAAADTTTKVPTERESKTLSEKDAKVIRKFLQEVGPYETDALRIAIAMADGKVNIKALPSDEQLVLNRYMNNGMTKEQNTTAQVQTYRIHRASQLCKRTADYCSKLQLLAVYEALMEFAVNTSHVEQARLGLDKMTSMRTSQQTSVYGSGNSANK